MKHSKLRISKAKYLPSGNNLMREVLDLQNQLALVRQEFKRQLQIKDTEIARLHEVILRIEDGRSKLDMYLQEWVLENGNPVYPVHNDVTKKM